MDFLFLSFSLINKTLYEQYQSYSVKFPRKSTTCFGQVLVYNFLVRSVLVWGSQQ